MISFLEFANRVRRISGLPPLVGIRLLDADPDSDTSCLLARAFGGSIDAGEDAWLLVTPNGQEIAQATGLEYRPDQAGVVLPWEIVDAAVSFSFGFVVGDDTGHLVGWWVPDDDTSFIFVTPTEPLLEWRVSPARGVRQLAHVGG